MFFFLTGVVLLALIISVFWLKDQLENPLLARIAYSGLVARLAVVGAAFVVLGLLLMLADFAQQLSA
jgi:predicted phage tail protein